ncbi:MAG TPA: CARDB domain-containing protein [Solirubrobacteraceae bacterium]|nr:CARDB domain-containing protein [Solirubrobacteraceae bacterium]
MLRTALIVTGLTLAFPAAAAAAPASVALTACEPRERAAEFEARMDKVGGAARMKLRFTLEARKAGKGWRRVAAPELGGWRTADAATTRYISSRRVTALVGPASYRTLVRFRWLDATGRTFARSRARSKACWQPDHRPNLKLRALSFEGATDYVVLVANNGRSATGPFDLELTGFPTQLLASLEPGEERLVEVPGPPCQSGTRVTATADPLDVVDERRERDNALTRPCP